MKTNTLARETTPQFFTHEGAPAVKENAERELTRAVSTCMLYEETAYESGSKLAERIKALCTQVTIPFLCGLAAKARKDLKLRHVALFLCVQALAKKGTADERTLVGDTIASVIERADELAEIIALYWKDGKKTVPRQLRRGIAKAFTRFSEYALAKYNRDSAVKLRDALFLSHAKPENDDQAASWKRLVDGTLATPDTWEVALSKGADKKETFTRLIQQGQLGYMALLRNLRNCLTAGVDQAVLAQAIMAKAAGSKALPFRFVTAARHAPALAGVLSDAMLLSTADHPKLPGTTYLLVDVSGSMDAKLSGKSEMSRLEAGAALAILLREICPFVRVFTFSNNLVEVQSFRGLPLAEGIARSQEHGGTYLAGAVKVLAEKYLAPTRTIVITDEQSHDGVGVPPSPLGYLVNVATFEPALPTKGGGWTRISGFSERIVDWVMEEEMTTTVDAA